ncbi:MAG TPA: hypothetical protein PL110_02945, partial [Candidatus Eremiobacteraeota bacterium]|nr:hypothetical protein [Candidatus Eremiobacteraeota bacterium]
RLCNGEVDPGLFQLAIKNLIKRLDIADDEYFKQEANYTKEDLIILEDMLNSILEQSEFFRHTLQELLESSKLLDIRQIYTNLDKAKISETMYLKAGEKLKNLTKEEFIELGKKKGVEIKFQD